VDIKLGIFKGIVIERMGQRRSMRMDIKFGILKIKEYKRKILRKQ
jgi:hypothetical protein